MSQCELSVSLSVPISLIKPCSCLLTLKTQEHNRTSVQGCIDSTKLAPLPLLELTMEVNDNQKSPKAKPRL